VEILENKFKKDEGPQDVYHEINKAALDIIFEAALGFELKSQDGGENNVYAEAINT
jgi:hypothetical protein